MAFNAVSFVVRIVHRHFDVLAFNGVHSFNKSSLLPYIVKINHYSDN